MTEQERQRFDMLHEGPCVTVAYVYEYYGLPWPLSSDARGDYAAWTSRLARPAQCPEGRLSRYELEGFMQQNRLLPKKWMAARLGMDEDSLDELLTRLAHLGMRPRRYVVYDHLIADSLAQDIALHMPGLQYRAFSDHNSFCARLHAELQNELGLAVQPLFCATAVLMGDCPTQYASHFDCITLAPVSGKHQVWLDFRKPLTLPPDRCSKLFYSEHRDTLRPFCAGTQEPDDLDQYVQFLAGKQHA